MRILCRRLAILACAGLFALAACSSNATPPMQSSSTAQSLTRTSSSSSYAQLMSQTAALNNAQGFTLTSTVFKNNGTLPRSAIGNFPPTCVGGDQSPPLFWSNPPAGTKSFALITFDETASFGHWGIYNMRPNSNRLPQGVQPGNIPGLWMQVYDDNVLNGQLTQGYTGPCPPPGLVHRYVFTIYALNSSLTIPNNGFVPPLIETLLYYMTGHVIGRASVTGLHEAP